MTTIVVWILIKLFAPSTSTYLGDYPTEAQCLARAALYMTNEPRLRVACVRGLVPDVKETLK